ncbi:Speckle-type POZ protein [Hordeum vulgare]|nr:Speckle-type POZ protein [Hordeum vulgare]
MDGDVPKEPPSGERRNYNHYYEVGGPTNVYKEFKLKTNTGCSMGIIIRLLNDRVTLDQGWATFTAVHQIKIGFMMIFKLLTPNMLKAIIFNDDGILEVTRCGRHDDVFVNA